MTITNLRPGTRFKVASRGVTSTELATKQDHSTALDEWANKARPGGATVGTTDTQTLTNKTITFAANTLTGVQPHTIALDEWAGKARPGGATVGTSDAQTLTSKTLTSPTINGGTITGITDLAVADGGTGASTAAAARTSLGVVIGTHVQAQSTALDEWAAKARPAGAIVGTTDTQTLTNKTLASPTITGTPTGITKTDVGLANVDNTSDAAKPVSTAQAAALQPKDATLVALAGLNSTPGILEQTGADAFTKRSTGVGGSTALLTRADGDGRFAPLANDASVNVEDALDALIGSARDRPGDAMPLFSATLIGSAAGRDPLDEGTIVNSAALGSVLQIDGNEIPGAGFLDIALSRDLAVETGRIYALRWAIERSQNPVDPANEGVELRLACLNNAKALISSHVFGETAGDNVVVEGGDHYELLVSDGVLDVSVNIARAAGDGVTFVVPSTTRYATVYVRLYGSTGATRIGVVDFRDATDTVAIAEGAENLADEIARATTAEDLLRVKTLNRLVITGGVGSVGDPYVAAYPTGITAINTLLAFTFTPTSTNTTTAPQFVIGGQAAITMLDAAGNTIPIGGLAGGQWYTAVLTSTTVGRLQNRPFASDATVDAGTSEAYAVNVRGLTHSKQKSVNRLLITGGTGTGGDPYVAAVPAGITTPLSALTAFSFTPGNANTASAPQIVIGSEPAITIADAGGNAVAAGGLAAGQWYSMILTSATTARLERNSFASNAVIDTGTSEALAVNVRGLTHALQKDVNRLLITDGDGSPGDPYVAAVPGGITTPLTSLVSFSLTPPVANTTIDPQIVIGSEPAVTINDAAGNNIPPGGLGALQWYSMIMTSATSARVEGRPFAGNTALDAGVSESLGVNVRGLAHARRTGINYLDVDLDSVGDAYAADGAPWMTEPENGAVAAFLPNVDSLAGATIAANGGTAIEIRGVDGTALLPGDLSAGILRTIIYLTPYYWLLGGSEDGMNYQGYDLSSEVGTTAVLAVGADPTLQSLLIKNENPTGGGDIIIHPFGGTPVANMAGSITLPPTAVYEPIKPTRQTVNMVASVAASQVTIHATNRSGRHPNLTAIVLELFGRMTTPPSFEWLVDAYYDYVNALLRDRIWYQLEMLHVPCAAPVANEARRNWIDGNAGSLGGASPPTHTLYLGWTGTATGFFTGDFPLSSKFKQLDSHMMCQVDSAAGGTANYAMGIGNSALGPARTATTASFRSLYTSGDTVTVGGRGGFYAWARNEETRYDAYYQTTHFDVTRTATASVGTYDYTLMANTGSGGPVNFYTGTLQIASAGAFLSADQMAAYKAANDALIATLAEHL